MRVCVYMHVGYVIDTPIPKKSYIRPGPWSHVYCVHAPLVVLVIVNKPHSDSMQTCQTGVSLQPSSDGVMATYIRGDGLGCVSLGYCKSE